MLLPLHQYFTSEKYPSCSAECGLFSWSWGRAFGAFLTLVFMVFATPGLTQSTLLSEDFEDGADNIIDSGVSSASWTVGGGTTTASNQNSGATWQSVGAVASGGGALAISADVVTSGGGGGSAYTTGTLDYSTDNGSNWTTIASFANGNATYAGAGGTGLAVSSGATVKIRFVFPELKKYSASLDNILVTFSCPDADGDGVCDADEVTGCTDATACNYDDDPTTDTDNALCAYATGCDSCSGQTDGTGTVVDGDVDNDGICDDGTDLCTNCLLYTSPSPRDRTRSRMPSSA